MPTNDERSAMPAGGTTTSPLARAGARDVSRAQEALAARVPASLAPFAWLAYNYAWSWAPRDRDVFEAVDAYRWSMCRENPVRLLQEAAPGSLARAEVNESLIERAGGLRGEIETHLGEPPSSGSADRPVAFLCAEYGVHRSLPTYSGGLGVLAGDILKEVSDRAFPLVGVGIMYRQGNFHQNIDRAGWQHEYWIESDPDRLPAAL